jgi:thioredoxin-related protein
MTREVYPDKELTEFSKSQIFMRFFSDTEPEGERLARKFGVKGFPTLIILDSKGNEVDRIIGERSAPDLIDELKDIFETARSRGKGKFVV